MRWVVIAIVALMLLVAGCASSGITATTITATTTASGGGTTAAPAASTTTTGATATTAAKTADAEAVKSAVRAYSAAFLGGQAKKAWLMRTPAAQARDSYAQFAIGVAQAKQIYGDAKMISLVVKVTGDTAQATYTYDISEINQKDQVWVKQGGTWLVDN